VTHVMVRGDIVGPVGMAFLAALNPSREACWCRAAGKGFSEHSCASLASLDVRSQEFSGNFVMGF
jgi:hypothetical protein